MQRTLLRPPRRVHYPADTNLRRGPYRRPLDSAAHLAIGVVRITTALASNAGRRKTTPRLTGLMWRPRQAKSRDQFSSRTSLSLGLTQSTIGESNMRDIIFVAVTIAFFLISIAYVKFCDRIR